MSKKEHMKQSTGEWYLYHHINNENALLPVIVISFLTLFLHGGILISMFVWVMYILYCVANNNALNNDPVILKDREAWKKIHQEKGDWEECKRILGI